MSIFLLLLGCFVLYGRSRFFPEHFSQVGSIIKKNRQITLVIGCLLLISSYILFSNNFGWGTGFVVYLVALSLFYSLLVIALPLHKRYIYTMAILCVLLIFFENFIS